MSYLSFSDFDIQNNSKLDKKERGYDVKDANFYRYIDSLSHQSIQNTDLGVSINTIDDIKDGISIFTSTRHAEKEYERAIDAFNTNGNIKSFSAGLNNINNNNDFKSKLEIKDFSTFNIKNDFNIIAKNYNEKLTDPTQRIERFQLINNSIQDTLDAGVIKIITADGKDKELSLKYRINIKSDVTSAKTLEAYLKDYSTARTRLEQSITNNSKIVADYIRSDIHLSDAFAGKSSKDIDDMIKKYKSHEKAASKCLENGKDIKNYKHDALVNLAKTYPQMDVVLVAEGIRDTKRIAEKQRELSVAKNKKRANISKMSLKTIKSSDMSKGYNTCKVGVDIIRKTINMSNKFSENAAMKMYTKAGKQQIAAQEKINVIKRKSNGGIISLRDQQKIDKLNGKNVKYSRRENKAKKKIDKINAKRNTIANKRNKRIAAKQGAKANKMAKSGLKKISKNKFLAAKGNLFSPMNVLRIIGSLLPVYFIISLVMGVAAIIASFAGILTGGTVTFRMQMVTEGIKRAANEEERRDYLCESFLEYNNALDNKYPNSVLAGYAAYVLYVSDNGSPIYDYDSENYENTWGMLKWKTKDDFTLYKKLNDKLDTMNIEVFELDKGILLNKTLDDIASSYEDSQVYEDQFVLFTKDKVYSLIRSQSLLCMYSLEFFDSEVYEYLSNYKGNTEDDAVNIAKYLAEKLGKTIEIDINKTNNVSTNYEKFSEEEVEALEELTRSIAKDEIRTAMNVVFDFGGAYENMTVPITPGQTAIIPFTGREEIKTQIIFKPYILGIDNYTFDVTAKLEGMYTGKNGQGTKVYNSDGTMTEEIKNAGGYGTWNKLYAYYGNYTPIEVPTYCVSEETIKIIKHEHSDSCETEFICKYKNSSYHPHNNACVERYEYYNYRNELIKTTKIKDTEFTGGYCNVIYKCKYKDNKIGHPHEDECINYLCDTTPIEVPGVKYTYIPYWTSTYNGGTKIIITGTPEDKLIGGTFIADSGICNMDTIIFEAPDTKATHTIEK